MKIYTFQLFSLPAFKDTHSIIRPIIKNLLKFKRFLKNLLKNHFTGVGKVVLLDPYVQEKDYSPATTL